MDIICAKCGKHFSSIEAARGHRGHCKETSEGDVVQWISDPKTKITPEEWEKLMRAINLSNLKPHSTTKRTISRASTQNNSHPHDGIRLNPNIAKPISNKSIIIICIILIMIVLSVSIATWYIYFRFGSNWWLLLCIPVSIVSIWCVILWIQRIFQEVKG